MLQITKKKNLNSSFFFFDRVSTKKPIDFLCKRELNLRSLIQLLETLPVKQTRTHNLNSS